MTVQDAGLNEMLTKTLAVMKRIMIGWYTIACTAIIYYNFPFFSLAGVLLPRIHGRLSPAIPIKSDIKRKPGSGYSYNTVLC